MTMVHCSTGPDTKTIILILYFDAYYPKNPVITKYTKVFKSISI